MISPMQRYISHVKPKDAEGNEIEPSEDEAEAVQNPKLQPCGGFKSGRVHFDAEVSSKIFVAWKTVHPDVAGNCTIRIGSGDSQGGFNVIQPVDGSGMKTKGKFPCGREERAYDGKLIKLPFNMTCDDCTL
mgnify:CR=1 FL=1